MLPVLGREIVEGEQRLASLDQALMLSPDSWANLARCQAEAPLIALCRFPKPALLNAINDPNTGLPTGGPGRFYANFGGPVGYSASRSKWCIARMFEVAHGFRRVE